MPFPRPTLSELRGQVAADISAGLPTVDGLLRFSNLNILGTALAGLGHLNYGYLDWIAQQACPYTATDEFLEAWAGLKGVLRKPASNALGQVTFAGVPGRVIPAGAEVVRSDTLAFVATSAATVGADGKAVVSVQAVLPGSAANTPAGSQVTLGSAVDGVGSTGAVTAAIIGGADQELNESLRDRMLTVYQNPPSGGSRNDYVEWAEAVAGVTRAWCSPGTFGVGSVVVYAMLDRANVASGGFPVGGDGVSPLDLRSTDGNRAKGDQLAVANAIFAKQPATPLVYVCAPKPKTIDFKISGLSSASATLKASVAGAIADVMVQYGAPLADGSKVMLSVIDTAIAAISGTDGFVVTSPTDNIVNTLGFLPVLGSITYS